jgi:uncharacterized protein HemY
MRYETHFTDEQIVVALQQTAERGIKKEAAADNVQPPNLCAFLNNLPVPERERLVNLAYPSAADQPMQ